MAKFRHLPTIVDAQLLTTEAAVRDRFLGHDSQAKPGDVLLIGPDGDAWPVAWDVFISRYEPVSAADKEQLEEWQATRQKIIDSYKRSNGPQVK